MLDFTTSLEKLRVPLDNVALQGGTLSLSHVSKTLYIIYLTFGHLKNLIHGKFSLEKYGATLKI